MFVRSSFVQCAIAALVFVAGSANAEPIFGLTAASSDSASPGIGLVSFDSAAPSTINTIGNFAGVVAGHSVRSIDFRPATGELWAISTDSTGGSAQVYVVNTSTAVLTPVGAGFAFAGNTSPRVSMQYNPVVDRIRIVTGGGQNYRANPNTGGLVQADTNLSWAAGDVNSGAFSIIGISYTNSRPGAVSTTLYGWDYLTDSLVTIGSVGGTPNSPNGGIMNTVFAPAGALTGNAGFGMDISAATGVAYLAHDDPANSSIMGLYTINLTTGVHSPVGNFPTGVFITDITIPAPASAAALGLLTLGAARRRR